PDGTGRALLGAPSAPGLLAHALPGLPPGGRRGHGDPYACAERARGGRHDGVAARDERRARDLLSRTAAWRAGTAGWQAARARGALARRRLDRVQRDPHGLARALPRLLPLQVPGTGRLSVPGGVRTGVR